MTKDAQRPYEQLIFGPRTHDLQRFEELSAAAKDAGFTHICISDLSERTDYQGDDKDSPWCEWSVNYPSLFKHATPEGLEAAFPADFVRRQMEFMKEKHEIVARLGLRASYRGLEPLWLSERVYAKHPDWRGSRCDNSLRTTGMYFSPNVDHPEVRAKYRQAVKEIVTACPLIDTFVLHTNDCGAGYPWCGRLYVNPNGPTGTIGGDMGVRVAEFLKTLREGAAEAGVNARIFSAVYSWFTPEETQLVLRSLEPGIGLVGLAPGELTAECSLSSCGGWGGRIVDGYPTPASVVSGVRNVKNSPAVRFQASGNSMDYFTAFKVAMEMPPANTERAKMEVLARMAGALYAEDVVDEVIDAWYALERAAIREGAVGAGRLLTASLMLRWIVRPLVPHQELLTEDERSYWEPYIYQSRASQPESYLDYLNLTGKPMTPTWRHSALICVAIDGIEARLRSAAALFEKASEKTSSDAAREKLKTDALRVKARACLALTVRHFLQMGTLIYERDREAEKTGSVDPAVPDLSQGSMGSHGLFFVYRAMRWELDNTNELISLIKSSPVPLIQCAPDKSLEGALVMGPDLLDDLRKKVRIMLKYWRTAEDGYYRPTKGG